MKKYKFSVPYLVNYHDTPLFWEVEAINKTEARTKAVQELSTDSDVYHVSKHKTYYKFRRSKEGVMKMKYTAEEQNELFKMILKTNC